MEFGDQIAIKCPTSFRTQRWIPFDSPALKGFYVRGHPYMTSAKISVFLHPHLMFRMHSTLFLLSAFWGPPSLPRERTPTSYMEAPNKPSINRSMSSSRSSIPILCPKTETVFILRSSKFERCNNLNQIQKRMRRTRCVASGRVGPSVRPTASLSFC